MKTNLGIKLNQMLADSQRLEHVSDFSPDFLRIGIYWVSLKKASAFDWQLIKKRAADIQT